MNIEKKQNRLICIILFTGIFLPPILINTGVEPLRTFGFWLYFFDGYVGFIFPIGSSPILFFIFSFLVQFLTYAFLAWVIVKLVYPDKKSLPESTTSPKSACPKTTITNSKDKE